MGRVRRLAGGLKRRLSRGPTSGSGPSLSAPSLASKYERRYPQPQNAIDLIPGWTGAFPEQGDVQAGEMALYADPRLMWALEQHGDLSGAQVLELGPLEGAHSYMLEAYGAAQITAIEANKQAYLKCLITKEILGLTRCRFLLGDFETYLAETDQTYDLILASGVLYHMQNPVEVLGHIAERCDALILWTHYFDAQVLHAGDARSHPFADQARSFAHKGRSYTLHQRSYLSAWQADSYCGGPDDTHYWMEREDILALCRQAGFDDIRIAFEDEGGANGPSCLFYMRKS